jgi:hypothetical protein
MRALRALVVLCLSSLASVTVAQEVADPNHKPAVTEAAQACKETPAGRTLRFVCPLPEMVFEDSEDASMAPPIRIELRLPQGTPLRIAIDQRARVRHVGELVVGHVVETVYAFDEPVIPEGTIATGHVTQIARIPKLYMARSYASGDFSPYRPYLVTFDRLTLPTGEVLAVDTTVAPGTAEVVHLVTKPSKPDADDADTAERKSVAMRAAGAAGQGVMEGVHQAGTTARHAADEIRKPGKLHRIKEWMLKQSPYRPEYVAVGTRFNAVLNQELDFGVGSRTREELASLGSAPPADSVLHARLILEVSSATATRGSPVVAQLTEPLYSADHQLILPVDTRLIGRVLEARPARHLRRNGELRLIFEVIELPSGALQSVQGTLEGIEVDRAAHLKLDEEGGAHATNNASRYLSTGAAVALAVVAARPDTDRVNDVDTSDDAAVRAGSGASGFGLAGTLIALATKANVVSIVFSAYGATSSIYTNFLSRGRDVVLPKNAPLEIGLGTKHPKQ